MTSPDLEALKTLVERRIPAALKRITDGHGLMRVPAEDTDPDLVLADCRVALERLLAGQREPVGELIEHEGIFSFHTLVPVESLVAGPLFAAPPVQEAGRETFVKRLRELSFYFRREGRPVGGFTPYQAALECAKDVDALADEMETEK